MTETASAAARPTMHDIALDRERMRRRRLLRLTGERPTDHPELEQTESDGDSHQASAAHPFAVERDVVQRRMARSWCGCWSVLGGHGRCPFLRAAPGPACDDEWWRDTIVKPGGKSDNSDM